MKTHKNRKAFTIVEMVIVIAVIAILATVLVPTFSGIIKSANVSADQQFAASLNVQLALWQAENNRTISSEKDLREAINDKCGYMAEDGVNFYDTMTTKSAAYGYYYWYDYTNGAVFVATPENASEEMAKLGGVRTAVPAQFNPELIRLSSTPSVVELSGRSGNGFGNDINTQSSFRFDLIPGAYLMGSGSYESGSKGKDCNILDMITMFENLDNPEYAGEDEYSYYDYEDALNALKNNSGALEQALYQKVTTTTILTSSSAYSSNMEQTNVYRPLHVVKVEVTTVYVYDPAQVHPENADTTGVVNEVNDWNELAPPITVADGTKLDISNNVELSSGAIADVFAGKLEVHIGIDIHDQAQRDELLGLGAITGDAVIVPSDGEEYRMDPEDPGIILDKNDNPINETAPLPPKGMDNKDVAINYTNSGNPGTSADYFVNGSLYLAWDFDSVKIPLKDKLPSSLVNWSVSGSDLIQVNNGKITLKEGATPDSDKASAVVTATLKTDPSKTASINVKLVFPTEIEWEITDAISKTDSAVQLNYVKSTEYTITMGNVLYVHNDQASYVKLNTLPTPSVTAGEGTLFTVTANDDGTFTLVLDSEAIEGNSQSLNIAYGTYTNQTYTVTAKDNSSVGLKKNPITSAVDMGQAYLFRVGNLNTIKLSSLFSAEKEGKQVVVTGVTIYNAAATDGDGNRTVLGTSGSFNATYSANSNWENATIKFGGTGVAIIVVHTEKGDVELVVEVVDGNNITSASQLKSNQNNILLNNITLTDYGTNISFSGSANNHVVLYGNGFTFDITGGRTKNVSVISLSNADLDNVKIIGKLYETYQSSYGSGENEWYSSAVYLTGGSSTISNSYIFGCRANVSVHGNGNLELINTVLDCGRMANLDIRSGTVTLDGVTTINEPRTDNKNVAGFGILIAEEADPPVESPIAVIITGKGLKQYNWLSSADKNYLPSITGLSTLFNTLMSDSAYAEYRFSDGTSTYLNMGIMSLSSKVGNVVIDKTNSAPYAGESVSFSGHTGYMTTVVNTKYTFSGDDLAYRKAAYQWTPSKQNPSLPKFTWTSGYEDREHELSFTEGGSVAFNPNGLLSATKFGNALSVSVAMEGGSFSGSFNKPGTYVFVYTVTDPYIYNFDNSLGEAKTYTFRLTVEVTEIIESINAPLFNYTNGTGFKVVVSGGQNWITPVFDSSKSGQFVAISGSGDNTIYAPISTVHFKDNTSDFNAYYNIFDVLNIVNYTEKGANATGTTYNSSYKGSDLPSGLTWEEGGFNNGKGWSGYTTRSSQFARQTAKIGSDQSARDLNVKFKFVAGNGETYYYYIRYTFPAHSCPSGCVTPDTLVTLADGTQKRIDELTYADEILVWDFYNGCYTTTTSSILYNHGLNEYDVIKLKFSDGTELRLVEEHELFDVAANNFVYINADNADQYIGHEFVKVDGNSYSTVELIDCEVYVEETEAYTIVTSVHFNAILENMFTLSPDPTNMCEAFLRPHEVGENMTYDNEKLQANIEAYGLYVYEDFADYMTEEEFEAFSVAYFKFHVEKGDVTFEAILKALSEYVPNH